MTQYPDSKNFLPELKTRVKHLEEVNRWTIEALDLVVSSGDFQPSFTADQDHAAIFSLACQYLRRLMPFRTIAFSMVDESNFDFSLTDCEPESDRTFIRKEMDIRIEEGTFAWALQQNRSVTIPTKHPGNVMLLHCVATRSRVNGMFIGVMADTEPAISGIASNLLTIVLSGTAHAFENSALYKKISDQNRDLKKTGKELQVKVAERKAAEYALNVSKVYTEAIIQNLADTLIVVDMAAKILTVNPETCHLLGYTEEEILGKPVAMIFAAAEEALLFEKTRMKKLIEEGSVRDYDMTYKTKSGEKIPVSFSGSVMRNKDGSIIGIVGIARDMRKINRFMQKEKEFAAAAAAAATEREKAAQLEAAYKELRETQAKLIQEGKMSAVGKLAAGVAHEMNNPLTGVLTYAVLLKEELENAPEEIRSQLPEFPEQLDLIKLSAQRCKSIADNLLNFSRQSEPEMTLVNLSDVISGTFELIGTQIRHKGIKLTRDIPEGLPAIRGNANQLQQVFTNIVLNAIHVMDSGGKITVCAKRDGPECEVAISDTGSGIPKEHLDKIFEPFFTTKAIGKGTGLGLSIVYGIVQNHGGEITVDSVLGKGTTFNLRFPISE